MSKHTIVTVRQVVEQVFTGVAAVATIAVVAGGTLAMCFPGLGVA